MDDKLYWVIVYSDPASPKAGQPVPPIDLYRYPGGMIVFDDKGLAIGASREMFIRYRIACHPVVLGAETVTEPTLIPLVSISEFAEEQSQRQSLP